MKQSVNKIAAAAVMAMMALPLACAAANDTTASDLHRWNLKNLYASQGDWDKDVGTLEGQFRAFDHCKGKLGASVRQFKICLDLNADMWKRYYRLSSYSAQLRDEDTGAAQGMDLAQRGDLLGNRLQQTTAFFNPEILKLGKGKIDRFLMQDKSLGVYRFPLDNILRAASHTLDAKGESLIASFGNATGAAEAVYSTLTNADMPWPKVTLSDGNTVTLDQAAYTKYRSVNNRDDRKKVFDTFWGQWKSYERTFGVSFYEYLKKSTVYAEVRNYPDSLTRALDDNKVPSAVYNTLIEQANANLPTLHRYFKLRAKMLGISEMRYYDTYPPLVKSDLKFSIEDSTRLMLASVAPLGEDYARAMAQGTKDRWMDVYPRPRKLSGAYMNGAAYDVHPYLLLNHNDDYESLSTLAHEWGHAMHSYLANKAQPFVTANYPTFTAEIASTTNEVLLLDHMMKIAKTDDERLLYLGSDLENLRTTFFRQAMFADFERTVHAQVDKGESLTGEAITTLYGDILKRYHGHKEGKGEGVVKIDDAYAIEWAYIPHFYNGFYVFQYATSISAGSMFAAEILKGTPGARDRYLNVLKAGGSRYPYELVKEAGVDLASKAPYQALAARMNTIMDQIEAIVAKRAVAPAK